MKAACLLLILSLAQAEEGPQEAAYWAQKKQGSQGTDYWAQKKANMKSGNVLQRPDTGVNLRQKATSASDYWAQKKAQKTTATSNVNSDYWAQKKAQKTTATSNVNSDYWAQKKAQKTTATSNVNSDYWGTKKMDLANKNGPGAQNPKANLKNSADEFEPCPNGRIPMHVVSLSNRYDRWDRMSIRWNGMMLMHPEVCLDMGRFDATNGAKDPIPLKLVTKQWSTARNRKYVGNGTWYDKVDETLELTPGERGCAASHVRLWKKVAKMDGPAILVEDDAIPVDGFAAKLTKGLQDLPKDADILYLGYSKPEKSPWIRDLPGTDLAQAEYVWTTVGYMIWPSGARKLLQRLPVDSPVDNYMSWASHEKVTNVYAFKTPVIKQELPWNLASDVEHSDENNKNAKENMNSFHTNQDLKQQVSLLTRPFIAAQNSFHQMWTETMKGADEWLEETDEKSQSTKELEAIEAESSQ